LFVCLFVCLLGFAVCWSSGFAVCCLLFCYLLFAICCLLGLLFAALLGLLGLLGLLFAGIAVLLFAVCWVAKFAAWLLLLSVLMSVTSVGWDVQSVT
jgi:hypothetical protein